MQAVLPGHLSDDLWARILLTLEGGFRDGLYLGQLVPDGMAESQSQFLQLRLVCRKFNSVFKSHHRLSEAYCCLRLSLTSPFLAS